MATINDNNLPNGVRPGPVSGLYLITNSKGQTSRVNADNIEQLNTYNNSWQTGTPATVTRDMPDGSTRQVVYDPSRIQAQQQATTEYQSNLTALKRADILPNGDGTYSAIRGDGSKLTDAEVQQRLAAAGLPPTALDVQKNGGKITPNPTPAVVAASTAAVNEGTNTPSSLQPAPAAPITGTLNSPLTVDPALGATVVRTESNPANGILEPPDEIIQDKKEPGPANGILEPPDEIIQAKTVPTDANPTYGILEPQDETIQPKKVPADPVLVQNSDPEGYANIQEQNAAANEEAIRNAGELGIQQGLTTAKLNTQSQATQQDAVNFQAKEDWRVRLSLSPGATYLYKASSPGILAPLQATDGVIFPYTPAISVQYNANYDATELTHSNYKFFTYRGSAVDSVTIGCDFTAQDTFEANYLLAVIHFFRSMTKMFYGRDENPTNGTPPPLCYLSGLGAFQFDAHPLVITAFTYTLPTDVDYILAGGTSTPAGVNRQNDPAQGKPGESGMAQAQAVRMGSGGSGINPGAIVSPPNWQTSNTGTKDATYVPTKISLSITANPIVTRNDISNKFSLKQYATGALLRGTQRAGGGIW